MMETAPARPQPPGPPPTPPPPPARRREDSHAEVSRGQPTPAAYLCTCFAGRRRWLAWTTVICDNGLARPPRRGVVT